MLEPPSYLHRGLFPFAENIGCTPTAYYQPDCGGTLRKYGPRRFNIKPSTSSLSDLLYSSWLIPRSIFKHGDDIIHYIS